MLQNINRPGFESISKPNKLVVETVAKLVAQNASVRVAEVGIGIGATTLEVAKLLDNRGEIHLFDFEGRCTQLARDLAGLGYRNVVSHENSRRHWDSYNWSMIKLIESGAEKFNFVYLDGSHLFERDACAFFLIDRLLKVGGYLLFDDYSWTLKKSKWLPERDRFAPPDMIERPNIKMICDLLVDTDPRYRNIAPRELWQKIA